MAKKDTKKRKTPHSEDREELQRQVNALKAVEHNPIAWGFLLKLFAPVIAKAATRFAISKIAAKTGRKISPKAREDIISATVRAIAELIAKIK